MKYMLLLYSQESGAPEYGSDAFQAAAREWGEFTKEVQAAGVAVSMSGLSPVSNATTIRVRDGKTLTADGPFAETHEQLGGAYLFECKDLDEAVRWAAKIPTAKYGAIEVRPLWAPPQQ
jgi:hypothetical protein